MEEAMKLGKKIVGAVALMAGMGLAAQASAAEMRTVDTVGGGLMTNYGECWKSLGPTDKGQCGKMQPMLITIDSTQAGFDFDSAELKPKMKRALGDVASKIKATSGVESVAVTGHTDSKGSEEYNQGLSERRAKAAAGYLAGQGVPASSISSNGKGESMPVASNDTEEGRAKNRRVEIQTH
jgi:outer membrane protein OmpA-like peptidoglycan-associated protein